MSKTTKKIPIKKRIIIASLSGLVIYTIMYFAFGAQEDTQGGAMVLGSIAFISGFFFDNKNYTSDQDTNSLSLRYSMRVKPFSTKSK